MNLKPALFISILSALHFSTATGIFNPREYAKRIVNCKATRRGSGEVVDLSLRYVDINPTAKTTILMVHGWPGLWSTWSNQIEEFKDYHLVIPDLRGFGESAHPGPDSKSSGSLNELVGDLVCVLEHAGVAEATCMGHDWGSQLCYEAARLRPDILTAVVGIVVPYMPSSGPFLTLDELLPALPKLAYQVYFDRKTGEAVAELDKDIRRTIRATLRTVGSPPPDAYLRSTESFLNAYSDVLEISPVPFLSAEEEDYIVEQYSLQGFKNTLQFYTHENRHAAWEHANRQGNFTISQPVLVVYPSGDPVANWTVAARLFKSDEYIPNLTSEVIEGAHWVHIEHPEKFNSIARKWLEKLGTGDGRIMDEL